MKRAGGPISNYSYYVTPLGLFGHLFFYEDSSDSSYTMQIVDVACHYQQPNNILKGIRLVGFNQFNQKLLTHFSEEDYLAPIDLAKIELEDDMSCTIPASMKLAVGVDSQTGVGYDGSTGTLALFTYQEKSDIKPVMQIGDVKKLRALGSSSCLVALELPDCLYWRQIDLETGLCSLQLPSSKKNTPEVAVFSEYLIAFDAGIRVSADPYISLYDMRCRKAIGLIRSEQHFACRDRNNIICERTNGRGLCSYDIRKFSQEVASVNTVGQCSHIYPMEGNTVGVFERLQQRCGRDTQFMALSVYPL